jgi:hypothetical protein
VITTNKLTIYLQDHLAGASFGVQLARRLRGANEGTPYDAALTEVAREIEEDRAELEAILDKLGIGADRIKTTLAWAGEKAGRLKLNGQLTGYSPLSRVLELEGLMAGVQGKLSLWLALLEVDDDCLSRPRLEELRGRAEGQLELLREQHRRAAREAFNEGEPAESGAAGPRRG